MDDDFGFDFFEDEVAWEAASADREHHVLADGPATRREPASVQVVKRRRIVAAGAAAIALLIIVIVVATQGSSGRGGAAQSFLGKLSPIAADSQRAGSTLETLLSHLRTARTTSDSLARLEDLSRRARADLAQSKTLKPPKELRSEYQQAMVALDFRARGLQGLHDTLVRRLGSTHRTALASALALQVNRLVTSDVIWQDLVLSPTVTALKRVGLSGSLAPTSQFVSDPNVSSQLSIEELLKPSTPVGTKTTLALGDHGPAVVAWQTQLNRWLRVTAPAQTPLSTDGTFGPATQAATVELQHAHKITPDGIVGPATRNALRAGRAGKNAPPSASG